MDIRIGIAQSGQVVEVELAEDADRAELKARIDTVLGSVADAGAVLWLVDRRGKETGIPAARISFVELGAADADRRIGFGA